MKVLVSGQSGWVGNHVVRSLQRRQCIVVQDLRDNPKAIIHCAWEGLPNYESFSHFDNIAWQLEFIKKAVEQGITNITVTGTCLETLEAFIPYSFAKFVVRAMAMSILPELKWARLWYLWGEGQNENCLLPRLKKAKAEGQKEFRVIDGKRDFIQVSAAADRLVEIMLGKETGIMDVCSGVATPVADFCRKHAWDMEFIKDYPTPHYEPFSFHGTP